MSGTTLNQRLRDAELDAYAERPIREAAAEAWAKEMDDRRVRLASLVKRVLHRKPDSFPAPLKGVRVVAEVDGLLFGTWKQFREDEEGLGLVVICPICDEDNVYRIFGYVELGRNLANAAADSRCRACIEANRREESRG